MTRLHAHITAHRVICVCLSIVAGVALSKAVTAIVSAEYETACWAVISVILACGAFMAELRAERMADQLREARAELRDRGETRVVFVGGMLDGAETALPSCEHGDCMPRRIVSDAGTYRAAGVAATTYRMQYEPEQTPAAATDRGDQR